MPELPDDRAAALFCYLDGEMSPEEAAAFERELEGDAELREALDTLRGFDRGMKRFAAASGEVAPAAPDLARWLRTIDAEGELGEAAAEATLRIDDGQLPATHPAAGSSDVSARVQPASPLSTPSTPSTPSPGRRSLPPAAWLALAACVAGVVGGGLWFGGALPRTAATHTAQQQAGPGINLSREFARYLADPAPNKVCDTPEKFIAYTRERFGSPIAASFDAGVQLVGWRGPGGSYDDEPVTGEPLVLLANAQDGQPVIVLFQSAARPQPSFDESAGLHMHCGVMGETAVFEVSRRERAVVLPVLRLTQD